MVIEKGREIGEHFEPLDNIIHYILEGLIDKRYNHYYARIIIIEQVKYCQKRDEEYERKQRNIAHDARLEWNRLMPE